MSSVDRIRSLFAPGTTLCILMSVGIYLAIAHLAGFYILPPQTGRPQIAFEHRLDECALLWVLLWSPYGWVFVSRTGPEGAEVRGSVVVVVPFILCGITSVSKGLRCLSVDTGLPPWATLCYVALSLFQGLILSCALLLQTRAWRRRVRRGVCLRCGYDLTGNISGVCPECGTRVL